MRRFLSVPAALPPLLLGALLLGGCQSSLLQRTDGLVGTLTPYRIDIVQGNVVTQEAVAQVRSGMSRLQVRDLLGTPLLADPFHAQRWDYLFTLRRQGAEPQRRSVVVTFDGDVVKSVEAPSLPSERDFVASISRARDARAAPKLELDDDERRALPAPARRAPPPAEPVGAVREYPPLEPR